MDDNKELDLEIHKNDETELERVLIIVVSLLIAFAILLPTCCYNRKRKHE